MSERTRRTDETAAAGKSRFAETFSGAFGFRLTFVRSLLLQAAAPKQAGDREQIVFHTTGGTKVTETPKKWKLGHTLPAVNPKMKPKGGTKFSFRLNEKATVSFAFTRSKGAKHKRVYQASFPAGENHLYFDGAITKKVRLSAGTYNVTIVATNSAGRSTAAHELSHVVQQ